MNSQLKSLSPILWTKDLLQTISFYETVLGFNKQGSFSNFASLTKDSVEIMFVQPTDESEEFLEPKLTGSIFIITEKIDELWEALKDKVNIKDAIANREYLMRDFSILDNNGYVLVFGEDISNRNDNNTNS